MSGLSDTIKQSLRRSIETADARQTPYRHWLLSGIFPPEVYEDLRTMPFPVADLGGVSGTREAHNADRVYFSGTNLEAFKSAGAAAVALQDPDIVSLIATAFGAPLETPIFASNTPRTSTASG